MPVGFYYLGLFYCAAIWGATFYLVKDALSSVDPVVLVGYRFLLAALCLTPWMVPGTKWPFSSIWYLVPSGWGILKEAAVLAFWLTLLYITQTIGLRYTSASNSGFITGLFVLFVPLILRFLFGQPVLAIQWAAVGLAVLGLWILTGGIREFNLGDGLTILSALAYASHLLMTDRYVRRDLDIPSLSFHQFWMTGLFCLTLAGISGSSFGISSAKGAWVILFLALFPTLTAFFIQMTAQKYIAPLKVSLIFSLEPVFAAMFAWTLGAEEFRLIGVLGGGLIVTAMVLTEFARYRNVRINN
ncbi:MAG: DMT family transporter [Elusimicrobia bacterium]|nr:DMT family transporter [Elusimicrobiota bacterium]